MERKKITLKVALSSEKIAQLEEMKKPKLTPIRKPFSRPGSNRFNKHKPPISELGRTVKWLYKTYPDLFFKERSKPLKCGIEKDIFNLLGDKPEVTKKMLKKALRHYVFSFSYMNAVLAATHRYNLKGKEIEKMTDEHKAFAIEWLKERNEEKAEKEASKEKTPLIK